MLTGTPNMHGSFFTVCIEQDPLIIDGRNNYAMFNIDGCTSNVMSITYLEI